MKETGKVIGNIYRGDREYRVMEVGYLVNQRFRRLGYAAEALSAVIEDAFVPAFIGSMQSAARGTNAPGDCWKNRIPT